ncbi:amidohydrolase family protein [Pseudonocardia sp. N23]|uniref:amidohydrolase family protein n=1 Tax=Pseudonocardia sp. N23 TaxID=1987376 RepID=UPI000C027B05|nr:amidohydrolase family protein [Pseudonocardia sp. N23]GAY08482.1 2-amino-3-carboxymuconate-6-semialdehyde decarboxylase [Pseudonocardia sp. N23]
MYDVHTHVVPPTTPFLDRLAATDPRWARLEPGPDTGDVLVAGTVFRTVRRVAWDLDARRDEAAAAGGTGQLLSAMPELFAPWAPPGDGADYAWAFNDWLAGELGRHGGFYAGLGLVPLRSPDAAAAMLADVARAGLVGVELPAGPPTAALHTAAWAGFLDEAERLGLLVFVHAVGGAGVADYPHPMAANGVLFPASIGTAIGGLIATGAIAARPGLRLLASHGGGSLVTELPRIDFLRDTTPALRELMPESAVVSARRLWYDPLLFDAGLLRHLVEVVGPDRIVLGTDHPFMPADPVAFLDDPRLPAGFAAAVRMHNPAALLGLPTS